MKYRIVLAFSFVVIACGQCLSQSDKYFSRTYGTFNTEQANSVLQTLDGGYVSIAGAYIGNVWYNFLIRTDKKGDTIWTKIFGNPYYNYGVSIKATADSNYIIGGSVLNAVGVGDFYLAKIDTGGTIIWDKTYGDTLDNAAYEAQQTTDSGYIITGWSYDTNSVAQIHLIKTDASGNLVWEKKYGAVNHYESFAVQQTNDKGYILAGKRLMGVFNFDGYVLKVDSLGNFQWDYTFGGPNEDDGTDDVIQTLDGGYLIAGRMDFFSTLDIYLLKLDWGGNKEWDKTYNWGAVDVSNAVQQLADGNYAVVGSAFVVPFDTSQNTDAYIMKVTASGDSIWGRRYGGVENDYFYDVQLTSDSGFIACGRTESFGAGGADAWLVKMNCLGFAGPPVADFTYNASGDTAFFINQSDSAGNYLWDFGDGDTSAAVNPVHAYPDTGTYTVTLIASACGESDTLVKTVNITSVGIAEDAKNKNGAYLGNNIPNPFGNVSIIKAFVPEFVNQAEVRIYDLTGRLIKTYKLVKGYNNLEIHASELNSGIYIYNMMTDGKRVANKKMVIMK